MLPFGILYNLLYFPGLLGWGGKIKVLSRKGSRNMFSGWVYLKDGNIYYPRHSFGARGLHGRDVGAVDEDGETASGWT